MNYDGSPQAKNYHCADCGRAMVYADSLARHRAVCSVRLRKLIERLVQACELGGDLLGAHRIRIRNAIRDGRAALAEDGQGR